MREYHQIRQVQQFHLSQHQGLSPEQFQHEPAFGQNTHQPLYSHQPQSLHQHQYSHQAPHGSQMNPREAIKQDAEESAARHDFHRTFGDLTLLKQHQSSQAFHRDLSQVNNDLHRRGILPNLSIVEAHNQEGFGLQPGGGMGYPGQYAHQGGRSEGHHSYHPNQQQQMEAGPGQSFHHGGSHGGHGHFGSGLTYNGAQRGDSAQAAQSAKIVAQVAQEMGVDPATAVAMMLVESGGNPQATGDHGSSFGLFQLHRGGELGNMSPQQAFDPVTNARVALSVLRGVQHQYGDPGMAAAAAQRPGNRAAYARLVDQALPEARQLLGMA